MNFVLIFDYVWLNVIGCKFGHWVEFDVIGWKFGYRVEFGVIG